MWDGPASPGLAPTLLIPRFILQECRNPQTQRKRSNRMVDYSTVTDFTRLRGWSTSVPFSTAT